MEVSRYEHTMLTSHVCFLQWLTWLLVITRAFAQRSSCSGDISTYNRNGLIIPFKNLCGKDITAKVDFYDPTDELNWSDCLYRCVEKAPMCYGFDFTPYGSTDFSCWLMNATFPESSALSQNYTVDAAMLTADFLAGISDDCRTLGLLGCFQKNGQLGRSTTTTQASSMTTTISSAIKTTSTTDISGNAATVGNHAGSTGPAIPGPPSHHAGLSTGAKAGIGVGVGVAVLIVGFAIGVLILRRRKLTAQEAEHPSASDKIVDTDPPRNGRAELPADQSRYTTYGRVELESMGVPPISELASPTGRVSTQRHELDSYPR